MSLAGLCRRSVISSLIAATALTFTAPAVRSQDQYPSANVEVIVPFAAGGAVDVTGRMFAQVLSKALARTFVVVNRPGANSNIGNLAAVRAKPDGYTLLVSSIGLAANTALYKSLPYDPLKDLSPVSLLSNAPLGLFVNKDLPVSNLSEFIAHVKANPDKLDYASYGMGSSPHLAAELFQRVTGTKMIHIPFSGNAPATVATVTGTTQVIFCSTVAALPFVQNGGLKPIAFGDDRRSVQLPDVPTFKEQGVDFTMGTWFGLLAPRNTPQSVIDTLSKAVRESLGDAELQKVMGIQGARVVGSTPDEFSEFLKAESARLAVVIRDANIRAD
jgi:tripartite-type tricarboxylate transporter receptor subunit TctC